MSVNCAICDGEAKMVRKEFMVKTPAEHKIFANVPTIVCKNPDCGEESFDPQALGSMRASEKSGPRYWEVIPVFVLP